MREFLKILMKPFTRRNAGAGLISILMSAALLGIGVVIITQSMASINQKKTASEWRGSKSSLKRMLLSGTACGRLSACKGEETVTIYSAEGIILVRNDRSSRYGPFHVEARCQANKTVEFRIAAIRDSKSGVNPLTGKVLGWNSPDGVLIPGGELCGVPQFDTSEEKVRAPRIYLGKHCLAAQGTCDVPDDAKAGLAKGQRMCCIDGRDARKPSCPAGTYELSAYWDRENDWGLDGRWAVTCQ